MRPVSAGLRKSLGEATARYEAAVDEVLPYLTQERAIHRDIVASARLGFVADPISGHEQYKGKLAIPYISYNGEIVNMRFRSLDGSDPKYLGLPGLDTRLYGIQSIHEAGDSISITEGEMDRLILLQCGLHAVGVPGAKAFKRHHARCFAGFSTVYIWPDGDKAGRDFAQHIATTLLSARIVTMEPGTDVNDLYLAKGREGILEAMEI